MQSFTDVLKMGVEVKGTGLCGFTQAQLEQMGLTKAFIKKMVKSGVCKHIYVKNNGKGGNISFYGVEHIRPTVELEAPKPKEPKPTQQECLDNIVVPPPADESFSKQIEEVKEEIVASVGIPPEEMKA